MLIVPTQLTSGHTGHTVRAPCFLQVTLTTTDWVTLGHAKQWGCCCQHIDYM